MKLRKTLEKEKFKVWMKKSKKKKRSEDDHRYKEGEFKGTILEILNHEIEGVQEVSKITFSHLSMVFKKLSFEFFKLILRFQVN